MRWPLVASLFLVACAREISVADDVDDTLTADTDALTDDAVETARCDARLAWQQPTSGSVRVPVDADLLVGFDQRLPDDGSWSLEVDGVSGHAELTADRRGARFVPDLPLATDTAFTLRASVCDRPSEVSFTTRSGPASADVLAQQMWAVSVDDATWLAPSVSSVFAPMLDLPAFVLRPVAEDDGLHLVGRIAASVDGHTLPVPCAPVLDFGALDLSDSPHFSTQREAVAFRWFGAAITLAGVQVDGTFGGDGTLLDHISIQTEIDARVLEVITDVEDLCGQSAALGEPCHACSDGALQCLDLFVEHTGAVSVPPVDLYDDWLADLGLCED